MKFSFKTYFWIGLLIVPFGAAFDAFYIEKTTFLGYIYICLIEWGIFVFGLWVGNNMIKSSSSQSGDKEEGEA